MPSQVSQPSTAELDPRAQDQEEELDPELLGLPDPPRKERRLTLALLAVAAVASVAMAASLTRDAAYAFSPPSAVDLGDLHKTPTGAFASNEYVQGFGLLGGAGSIRYERPFESDSYRVAPVAGRPDVWVEVRVRSGEETNRYIPPTSFSGRLVPFAKAGLRHRGLRSAISDRTGEKVPAEAWLLVDGETPGNARWVAALWLMFVGFAVWNAFIIARLVRRVR